ncbi:MAG TPA: GNAT family N-acetyltransferase [Candidatus Obscuribacterales bacterium]
MESNLRLSVEDSPSQSDHDAFMHILRTFNRSKVDEPGYRKLCVLVRDADNRVVGGLNGETYLEWFYIENLAVDRHVRNEGVGTKLLELAEEEARKRRCHSAWVEAWSFQGLPFYQKNGYKIFGELKNFPQGHSRFFLYKKL